RDEDEVTQKVAIPKALKRYLQRQKTINMGVPNANGARRGFLKQEQATLKVPAPNGVKRELPEQATLKVSAHPGGYGQVQKLKAVIPPGAKARGVTLDE